MTGVGIEPTTYGLTVHSRLYCPTLLPRLLRVLVPRSSDQLGSFGSLVPQYVPQ